MNKDEYQEIYNYLKALHIPKDYDEHRITHLKNKSSKYFIQHHQLFRRRKQGQPQRVILPDQVEIILFNLHKDQNGAHLGIETTFEKAKERYYWPQMYETIRQYVKACENCQKRGKPNRNEQLIPLIVEYPFHRVGIDIKGPLPITSKENRYIIVAMDYLTKWPEAKAIKNAKAETVARFIYEEIICRHGVPEEMLSDRGTSFLNQVIKELCERFQTKHRLTSSYRPQTNGMIERFNRTIGECIAKLLTDKEKEWDEYIDAVLLAYRTMKHEATGFTPFQLLYGRQAKLPVDLKITTYQKTPVNYDEALTRRAYEIINRMNNEQIKARENIEKGQEQQKSRHKEKSTKLKIGDKVLVHRTNLQTNFSAKLEEKWIGPYYIHDVLPRNVYKLRNLDGKLVKNVIHGNRLKLFHEQNLTPIVLIEDNI